jgi:lipoprotein-anchoring transpeptidase ErfK/SrfK
MLAALLPLAAVACGKSGADAQNTADSVVSDVPEETPGSLPTEEEAAKKVEDMKQQMQAYGERLKQDVNSATQDARENAIAGLVATAAPGEFERRGVPLEGQPVCTAQSPSLGTYHVDCDATTTDNKAAKLVGDDPGAGDPVFVGSVDGKEVFKQGCIGVC